MIRTFILRIYRGTEGEQYFEEFELELTPMMNVISALMEIQKRPVNRKGETVTPVCWEMACLEEVCGSCSMLVNGIPRQACTAMIQEILDEIRSDTILLSPFSSYPVIRDLVVDRSRIFDGLKRVKAWAEVEGSRSPDFGEKIPQKEQELLYELSTCMSCGCCMEACPQYSKNTEFVGAAVVSQARLFNRQPNGKRKKEERLIELMKKGGLYECGNAQACVAVCPKKINLVESIAEEGKRLSRAIFSNIDESC